MPARSRSVLTSDACCIDTSKLWHIVYTTYTTRPVCVQFAAGVAAAGYDMWQRSDLLCDCRTDQVCLASSQPLPWLPVRLYHSFQLAATMASSQPLPVSRCHGFQSATTTPSRQLLPQLPVSYYHGFQSVAAMASRQLPTCPLLC